MDAAPSPSEKPHSNGSTLPKSNLEPETPRQPLDLPSPTTEYLLAAIYPVTLVLASTFYYLSPSDATSESYFSKKGNLINVIFVKYGWFWTTVAFMLHLSRVRLASKPKALIRWALATGWWIIVTQWCFGPPLMDRTFLFTGGACETLDVVRSNEAGADISTGKLFLTSAACKLHGGQWTGGHDLSGHVFLLTHASLFLWSEVLPVLRAGAAAGVESGAVFGILGMWWWMLLMTGIYFHTWQEKVTGFIVGVMQWGAVYLWGLRAFPELGGVLGVPGI